MRWSEIGRIPAPALVVASIASVQTGSAIARTLFDSLSAEGVTLLRLGVAALLMLVVLRPPIRSWSGRSWRAAVMLGGVMAAMNLAFYLSLRTIPLGIAVTVEFIGPLLLALVQTRRLTHLLWAGLAAGGVVLLGFNPASDLPWTGLAFALLAGLFWAGYILASAHMGRVLPGMDGLVVAFAVATCLLLPIGVRGASHLVAEPSLFIGVAAVAVLSSVLPYGLELQALRRIPTRVFGVLMSLEPAAAALSGLVVLGQRLGPREITALVLVSLASVGVTLGHREGPYPRDRSDSRHPAGGITSGTGVTQQERAAGGEYVA